MNEFEDIEQLLKPQCEFKASDTLKQEVMEKARQEVSPRRIIRLWPWLAAACVAALLVVFLGPPREDASIQPQIAKVEPQNPQPVLKVQESDNVKEKPQATVTKKVAKAPRKARGKQVVKSESSERTLIKVEASDIVPYDDPQIQFEEQAKALRERGNRIIQRVSMNLLPQNNNSLNDI